MSPPSWRWNILQFIASREIYVRNIHSCTVKYCRFLIETVVKVQVQLQVQKANKV
uniref:Uncharacterized protein n=1 Tax=Anguilla anguilla TaxID=7936 RepID=A0A0E9TNY5_ANGAN